MFSSINFMIMLIPSSCTNVTVYRLIKTFRVYSVICDL